MNPATVTQPHVLRGEQASFQAAGQAQVQQPLLLPAASRPIAVAGRDWEALGRGVKFAFIERPEELPNVEYWNGARIWERISRNNAILNKWFSGTAQAHALRRFQADLVVTAMPNGR